SSPRASASREASAPNEQGARSTPSSRASSTEVPDVLGPRATPKLSEHPRSPMASVLVMTGTVSRVRRRALVALATVAAVLVVPTASPTGAAPQAPAIDARRAAALPAPFTG